eukprot:185121-Chlamydomonas_euryale.AAC.1
MRGQPKAAVRGGAGHGSCCGQPCGQSEGDKGKDGSHPRRAKLCICSAISPADSVILHAPGSCILMRNYAPSCTTTPPCAAMSCIRRQAWPCLIQKCRLTGATTCCYAPLCSAMHHDGSPCAARHRCASPCLMRALS